MDLKNENIINLIKATQSGVELKPIIKLPDYSKLCEPIEVKPAMDVLAHEAMHLEQISSNTHALLNETIQLREVAHTQANEIAELRTTILDKEQLATKNRWKDRFIGAFFTISCGLIIYCITNFSIVINFFNSLFS